jgi:hypothetical protein
MSGRVRGARDERAQYESLEARLPPAIFRDYGSQGTENKQRAECHHRRDDERRCPQEQIRGEWHCACHHKRNQRREAMLPWMPLEFRKAFGFTRALVRTNRQKISDSHRDPVSGEVRCADDEHGELRQLTTSHAAHHGKSRDDAVVGAVHEIADVVACRRRGAARLDVQRRSHGQPSARQ